MEKLNYEKEHKKLLGNVQNLCRQYILPYDVKSKMLYLIHKGLHIGFWHGWKAREINREIPQDLIVDFVDVVPEGEKENKEVRL